MKTFLTRKSLLIVFLLAIIFIPSTAQTTIMEIPGAIGYEAYAYDAANNRLPNQNISLRLTILHKTQTGIADWVERHQVTTDLSAYFSVHIGEGVHTGGVFSTFADVDWDGAHFLKIEMDITGGNNFTFSVTEEFTSVPFALRAAVADSLSGVDKDSLQRAITISGLCSCTLQEAYNNGNAIVSNTTGGTAIRPVSITNFAALTGANFISTASSIASNFAGVFQTGGGTGNAQPTTLMRNNNVGASILAVNSSTISGGINSTIYSWAIGTFGSTLLANSANAANSDPAIRSQTIGQGESGLFTTDNPVTTAYAIKGEIRASSNTVNAGVGDFLTARTNNNATAVRIQTNGLGRSTSILTNNLLNTLPALDVQTNGLGSAINAMQIGAGGAGGFFQTTNTNNTSSTLNSIQFGTGLSGYFESNRNNNQHFSVWVRQLGDRGSGGLFETNTQGNNWRSQAIRATSIGTGNAALFSNTNTAIGALNTHPVTLIQQRAIATSLDVRELNSFNTSDAVSLSSVGLGRTAFVFNTNQNNTSPILEVTGTGSGTQLWAHTANTSNLFPIAWIQSNNTASNKLGCLIETNSNNSALLSICNGTNGAGNVAGAFFNSSSSAGVGITSYTNNGEAAIISSANGRSLQVMPLATNNSNTMEVSVGSPTSLAAYFYGPIEGNSAYTFSGTKSTAIKTSQGEKRLLYCEESPEVWFNDYGFGQLVNGQVTIGLDPLFISSANLNEPYHVFIQLEGECKGGVYVTNKNAQGFTVVQQETLTTSNASFSYRISAKRKYCENLRYATTEENRIVNNSMTENVWPETIAYMNAQRQSAANIINNVVTTIPQTPPATLTEKGEFTEDGITSEPIVPALIVPATESTYAPIQNPSLPPE